MRHCKFVLDECLTEENKNNLRILAQHTAARPEDFFNMADYVIIKGSRAFDIDDALNAKAEQGNECGAVCCVIGGALEIAELYEEPQFKPVIVPEKQKEGYTEVEHLEGWDEYERRLFGICVRFHDFDGTIETLEGLTPAQVYENKKRSEVWDFLFCGRWDNVDNTPKGAAKRIHYFLTNGLPENADQQRYGQAELSYMEGA